MRLIGIALVLLVCGLVQAEPDTVPSAEELRVKLRELGSAERNAYLESFSEEQLGQILDELMAGKGGWARRAVGRALGWKMLDRRAARLRSVAPSAEDLGGAPRFTVLAYPRTDGSTSTLPLERLIACRLFDSPYVWGGPPTLRSMQDPFVGPPPGGFIGAGGGKKRPPLVERAARGAIVADAAAAGNERLGKLINHLLVRHSGTHGGWVNLIERNADLVFVARGPSPDELKLAAERGVQMDVQPLARDAFEFLVNRLNPIESLTLEQIRGIYTGAIENWKEVGGDPGKIEPFQRNRNSGSQELFRARVMGNSRPEGPSRDLIRDSMIGPYNAVAERKGALGYTVWYYERYMAFLPEVKPLAISGVRATPETVADGTYPIVTTVYAAVRADEPAGSAARRLRDWLLTDAGQAVVAESGYVPIR